MSDAKSRRAAELAEKKKRLAAYRAKRRAAAAQQSEAQKETSSISSQLANILDVDLLGDTSSQPAAQDGPEPGAPGNAEEEEEEEEEAAAEAPAESVRAGAASRRVSLQTAVVSIDCAAPAALEVYSKRVQTTRSHLLLLDDRIKAQIDEAAEKQARANASKQPEGEESTPEQQQAEEPIGPSYPVLSEEEKSRLLQSSDFVSFLQSASTSTERALFAREHVDVLVDYTKLDDAGADDDGAELSLHLSLTLQDTKLTQGRSVTSMQFSEAHSEILACAYSANPVTNDPDGLVLLWNALGVLDRPEFTFTCQSPVTSVVMPKFHPTMVLGGTYSGQLVLWDTRAKKTPVQATPFSGGGHAHPVHSMAFVGTKNANSLITVSSDGRLCSWSLDNLQAPKEVIELKSVGQGKLTAPVASTGIAFPEGDVDTFVVASEEGVIYRGARHSAKGGAQTPRDQRENVQVQQMTDTYNGHVGLVTSVDVHPAVSGSQDTKNLLLSAGVDWSVRLWSPARSEALLSIEGPQVEVYDAKWSPKHSSVFASVDGAGTLSLWDLNRDYKSASSTVTVDAPLNKLCWSSDGSLLAAGDVSGVVHVYQGSKELSNPPADAWQQLESTISKLMLQ